MWKMQKNVEIILQLMMEQFMQMEHSNWYCLSKNI